MRSRERVWKRLRIGYCPRASWCALTILCSNYSDILAGPCHHTLRGPRCSRTTILQSASTTRRGRDKCEWPTTQVLYDLTPAQITEFDVEYTDTVSVSLATSYLFNYPAPSFARLPIELTVSLAVFKSTVRTLLLTSVTPLTPLLLDIHSPTIPQSTRPRPHPHDPPNIHARPEDKLPHGQPRQTRQRPKTSRAHPTPSPTRPRRARHLERCPPRPGAHGGGGEAGDAEGDARG